MSSEELRQKRYLNAAGELRGDSVGELSAFNLGATNLEQLRRTGIIPDQPYGARRSLKPDGLVVDLRGASPVVELVVEFKNRGELSTERARTAFLKKLAEEYCSPLGCRVGALSDGDETLWLSIDPTTSSHVLIKREDGYPLDVGADLATDQGRELIRKTLSRIRAELNPTTAALEPPAALNPTHLAEQTWQAIWLASGESPDACLATFVEILIFKFLSDLRILTRDPGGVAVDFATVKGLGTDRVLRYYFEHVRPEIKRLFPPGADGTSVINGIVLDHSNRDHGRLFSSILARFDAFGTLRRIDPEFKSRIFERFLKKSISQKNWGQYFTPRNVVKAMVEMSGIEHLPPGAVVADPACGVGGFVLEPLVHKRPHDFRSDPAPSLAYRGWDRDPKTVILAKANMLIHLSDMLEVDPTGAVARLAPVLSATFQSTSRSITGSLALAPHDMFDLVITNPPYVVAGTGTQRSMIEQDASLASYYSIPGLGVENLFLQLIIKGLKPGARALVIVPDGLLLRHSEEPLRRHILQTCNLEAVVSLPRNTFYSTPKKTYVLVFRKKQLPGVPQTSPVLTYLIGSVGETLDAKRFIIPDNDLPKMAETFRLFQGDPRAFAPPGDDPRLRIQPIDRFKPEEHWLVDRWWSIDERVALGDIEGVETISPEDLSVRLRDASASIGTLADVVATGDASITVHGTVRVSLGDATKFRLSIGKRVLKQALHGAPGGSIPLYSANVNAPFGHVTVSNLQDFSNPSILYGIDGNFEVSVKEAGAKFAITDHCGRIEVLDALLDARYCAAAVSLARADDFDRTLRPSLERVKKLEFEVPILADGTFDLAAQRSLVGRYTAVVEALRDAAATLEGLSSLKPDVMRADLPQAGSSYSGAAAPSRSAP